MEKFEVLDMANGEVFKQLTEARLNAELLEARRDSDRAMRLAEKDRQALLDTVKHLNAELDAELAESAKWRDIAERCFASAMKNAIALADERKGKRGE